MRYLRPGVLVATVVLVGLGGMGCSRANSPQTSPTPTTTTPTATPSMAFAGESSDQIMQRALDAYRAAHTVHVLGERNDGGKPTLIDLSIDLDRAAYIETLRPGGHTVELRMVDGKLYIKADPDYWRQRVAADPTAWNASPDQIAAILQGKYLVGAPQTVSSGADKTIAMLNQEVIYPNQAFGAFLSGPTDRSPQTTLNGTSVVTIVNLNRDSAENKNAKTLYLSAAEAPLPLRIEGPRGFLTFQDFGAPVTVTAPSANETVDVATVRAAAR